MKKLIDAFRNNPTLANEVRLRNYINKHHMALCLLSQDDYDFLRNNHIIR